MPFYPAVRGAKGDMMEMQSSDAHLNKVELPGLVEISAYSFHCHWHLLMQPQEGFRGFATMLGARRALGTDHDVKLSINSHDFLRSCSCGRSNFRSNIQSPFFEADSRRRWLEQRVIGRQTHRDHANHPTHTVLRITLGPSPQVEKHSRRQD